MKKNIFFTICLLFLSLSIHAQLLPELNYPKATTLPEQWNARWVISHDAPQSDYSVTMYRCSFTLSAKPESFIIHLSADNRYKLYVNGKLSAMGPQGSDPENWRYETLDIAPYLQPGKNVLAAEVVNWGSDRYFGIMSTRTGFMLQGNSEKEWLVNSTNDGNWLAKQNESYAPLHPNWMFGVDITGGLYASNPGDSIQVAAYPADWTLQAFDDSAWKHAKFIWSISAGGTGFSWNIKPRTTPQVQQTQVRFKVARAEGLSSYAQFGGGNAPVVVPPNTKASLLLDYETVTMGFPELLLSGGKDANIRITYAENLFGPNLERGDRNDLEGKHIRGLHDIIVPDGRDRFLFSPTWYRAFRFVQLDVQTAGEALTLLDYYNMATKAPVPRRAVFDCDNAEYKKIDEICWRTDAILTQDNLMSDAYYEQMMYVGDSRVHALVNLYMTGEEIWLRNAIEMFDQSREPSGILAGCYPTNMLAGWPGFTIVWVNMLHDYMMHCNDKEFVKRYANNIKASFYWHENNLNENGMINGHTCIDWYNEPDLPGATYSKSRNSAAYTLQYAEALTNAAELYEYIDMPVEAIGLRERAEAAKAAVMAACWNEDRQLLTEDPEGTFLDERPNILATIANVGDIAFQRELFNRTVDAKDISQSTYYFRFYYMLAMRSLGTGNRMDDVLDIWKDLLPRNMTTVPERIAYQRSEAHAWAAAPCIGFVRVAAGIAPAEPGYKSVEIAPELGKLNFIKASYPHYLGDIKVDLKRTKKGGLEGTVELPAGLTGTFKYNGTTLDLAEGVSAIKM